MCVLPFLTNFRRDGIGMYHTHATVFHSVRSVYGPVVPNCTGNCPTRKAIFCCWCPRTLFIPSSLLFFSFLLGLYYAKVILFLALPSVAVALQTPLLFSAGGPSVRRRGGVVAGNRAGKKKSRETAELNERRGAQMEQHAFWQSRCLINQRPPVVPFGSCLVQI